MKQRHKKIRFLHVRECNYSILYSHIAALTKDNDNTTSKNNRIEIRTQGLIQDLPKSLIKRLVWKIKIRHLLIKPLSCHSKLKKK